MKKKMHFWIHLLIIFIHWIIVDDRIIKLLSENGNRCRKINCLKSRPQADFKITDIHLRKPIMRLDLKLIQRNIWRSLKIVNLERSSCVLT